MAIFNKTAAIVCSHYSSDRKTLPHAACKCNASGDHSDWPPGSAFALAAIQA